MVSLLERFLLFLFLPFLSSLSAQKDLFLDCWSCRIVLAYIHEVTK